MSTKKMSKKALIEPKKKPEKKPKTVAIVIPVRSPGPFLSTAIESALSQTVPDGFSLKVVVCSGGGMREYKECEKFKGKIDALLLRNAEGAGSALNACLKHLNSLKLDLHSLFVLSADDTISAGLVSELCNISDLDSKPAVISPVLLKGNDDEGEHPEPLKSLNIGYNKKALEILGGWQPRLSRFAGSEMMLRVANANMKIIELDAAYFKRSHSQQLTKIISTDEFSKEAVLVKSLHSKKGSRVFCTPSHVEVIRTMLMGR